MVKKPGKTKTSEASELRRLAEKRLKALHPAPGALPSGPETQRLLHELQVHQIELEMQNDDLRRSRDELEFMLLRYTELYDFAPVAYLTLDRKGGILAVNLVGARLLGVDRARLLGRNFRSFFDRPAREVLDDLLRRVFAGSDKVSCEVSLLADGGDGARFLQIEAVADLSGDQCQMGVVDITDSKKAEAELTRKGVALEELNRSLSERVAQAVDDLRKKDRMLIIQDRLAVMGEMINNIAHQWRQPLNMLGLVMQELRVVCGSDRFSKASLDDSVAKGMDLIKHMSRTIEDFLNFFKSDKEKTAFSVAEVITRTLLLIEKTFKDQKIQVGCHIEGNPSIIGYPNEYAQVLLNILMNARDELVARGVVAPIITIRAFELRGRSVVTITDNAGGIAEEIIERVFDPYLTTKGPDKGTGIGLYMSKTIIENNMGGLLTVRNVVGGAEFRIEV